MGVTIKHTLDAIDMAALQAEGYTSLKLYYSSTPDGNFIDSSVASDPVSLAAAVTAGEPYTFVFSFSGGNPGMWGKIVGWNGATISSLNDASPFHFGGGTTLKVIRRKVGKLIRALYSGTLTANGSGTTAICTSPFFKRFRDDYFGGGVAQDGWFFNNCTNGDYSNITDWTKSSGTWVLDPAITSTAQNDEFEVMAKWSPEEFRDAINWALVEAYPSVSRPIIDTSTYTVTDQYRYPVPADIRVVNKVEIEANWDLTNTDDAFRGHPWREIAYVPLEDGLQKWLEFKHDLPPDRRLRITGTGPISQLYNDTDYTQLLEPTLNIVIYYAAHRLYALLGNEDSNTDVQRHRDQANYYLNLALDAKKRVPSKRRPKKWWQHDAKWGNRSV